MARLNIEDSLWADPRFQDLMIAVKNRHAAKGMVIELWSMAQKFWLASRGQGIPKAAWIEAEMPSALVECKLAKDNGDFIYAAGSKEQFAWLSACSENGKKGGPAAAKSRVENKGKSKRRKTSKDAEITQDTTSYSFSSSSSLSFSDSNSPSLAKSEKTEEAGKGGGAGKATWEGYKAAYSQRHGEPPVWNAKIAGQLKHFMARVPASEAPDIATFYVKHNGARYVQAMHPIGLLLMDAEKLRTEWATGRTMTSAKAKNGESLEYAQDQLRRIERGEL